MTIELPDVLDEDMIGILGTMCFQAGPLAHAFVKAGRATIKQAAENEQAFIIHWLLGIYATHKSEWRKEASRQIGEIQKQLK